MATLKSLIESCNAAFAANFLAGLKDLPLSELTNLTGASPPKRNAPSADEPQAAKPAKAKTGKGGRLAKRGPEEMKVVIDNVVRALAANPEGLSREQLQKALSIDKKELTRPIVLALEQGLISKTGHKRSTRYTNGGGAAAGAKREAKAKRAARAPVAKKTAAKSVAKPVAKKASRKSKKSKTLVVGALPKEEPRAAAAE